ncbi:tryptophan-rich sensory protein [Mycobacterium fragae]|uniref:TspO protein n=1 Tax=Mycobacterium fragae TaxID=1260918 RepID=A0A1X1V6Z6_9MYCO|nr:TspO/MBR family protein [Mycobacterium fragae]MCV7401489.1 tryptophan-rich sensory protein [Mycobacterium fragae]ORV64855.1 TspO protein [Mycobacterium fragae]
MNKQTLGATSLAVATAAAAGSLANTTRTPAWYAQLRKPGYVPPANVFPIAWTSLYTDIAITSAMAIDRLRDAGRHAEARNYVIALAANLILNAGWSWLFFGYRRLGASALGAAVLAVSSADLTRRTAAADSRAAVALSPYPLWCAFATLMSSHIWRLNRRITGP